MVDAQCMQPWPTQGCHTQEALSYLQAMGAVQKLPEDVQWSIRAMLMRR